MALPFSFNLTRYAVPGSKLAKVTWAVCPDLASVWTGDVSAQAASWPMAMEMYSATTSDGPTV